LTTFFFGTTFFTTFFGGAFFGTDFLATFFGTFLAGAADRGKEYRLGHQRLLEIFLNSRSQI